MSTNLDCIYNDRGYWCLNKQVEPENWGLKKRSCKLFNASFTEECKFQKKYDIKITRRTK